MGASTVWGPKEAPFFACQLDALANPNNQPPSFHVPRSAIRTGPPPRKPGLIWAILSAVPSLLGISTKPFGPSFLGERRELPDDALGEILQTKEHLPERHLPFFEWDEPVNGDKEEFAAAAQRLVEVDYLDGTTADPSDTGFLKILREAPVGSHPKIMRWAAIWITPLDAADKWKSEYRFKITLNRSKPIVCESEPFNVDLESTKMPSPVSPKGNAACAQGSR